MNDRPLRLLVIDDSALYRQLVRNILREIPGVEVVGIAKSGQEALMLIDELDPDLLTLRRPDARGQWHRGVARPESSAAALGPSCLAV